LLIALYLFLLKVLLQRPISLTFTANYATPRAEPLNELAETHPRSFKSVRMD